MTTRPLRVLALGDSTSVGVGANGDGGFPIRLAKKLKASGRAVGFLNLGVSGATTSTVLNGPARRLARQSADLILLGIGTNDVWRLVPDDEFAQNLGRIADRAGEAARRVVVSNIGDLGLSPAATAAEAWLGLSPAAITDRIRSMNRAFDALARRPGFSVVDLFTASQSALARRHADYFSPDGFHPSAAGYDHWADIMWPAVEAAARDLEPLPA